MAVPGLKPPRPKDSADNSEGDMSSSRSHGQTPEADAAAAPNPNREIVPYNAERSSTDEDAAAAEQAEVSEDMIGEQFEIVFNVDKVGPHLLMLAQTAFRRPPYAFTHQCLDLAHFRR